MVCAAKRHAILLEATLLQVRRSFLAMREGWLTAKARQDEPCRGALSHDLK
jgi:hypothetical protein